MPHIVRNGKGNMKCKYSYTSLVHRIEPGTYECIACREKDVVECLLRTVAAIWLRGLICVVPKRSGGLRGPVLCWEPCNRHV